MTEYKGCGNCKHYFKAEDVFPCNACEINDNKSEIKNRWEKKK